MSKLTEKTPETSIVLPVYNAQEYIAKCIASTISQTYTDFELIIIDDGSTDKTLEIIKEFRDNRIRFFARKHLGIVEQLNFGLNEAKGKYFARLDSDDYNHPLRIDRQVNFLKQNSDISIVGCNIFQFQNNSKRFLIRRYPEQHAEIEYQMPIISSFCHPTILTYTNLMKGVGYYNKNYESAEDHELFLRMLSEGVKMHNIQDALYYYRLHEKSVTSLQHEKQNKISIKLGYNYLNNLKKKDVDNFRVLYSKGIIQYYRNDIILSRKYFLKVLKLYPAHYLKIIRYLLPSLLGNKILKFLRTSKITYGINKFFRLIFKVDTNQINR
jgi:glycosyltransferase involved in cell wall biosynthesis